MELTIEVLKSQLESLRDELEKNYNEKLEIEVKAIEERIKASVPVAERNITKVSFNETKHALGEGLWKIYNKEATDYVVKAVGIEGSATLGGNLTPTIPGNSLYQSPNEFGLARRICNIVPVNGKSQDFYTGNDLSMSGTLENASITSSNFTIGKVTLTPTKYAGAYVYSKELDQDSVVSLADEARKSFTKVLNAHEDALLVTRLEALPNANGLTASVTGAIAASVTSLDIFPQMISVVESNNASFDNGAFIGNPSVYWYFYQLKKTTGDPMINFDTATQTLYVYGKPFYKTNKMAGASVTTSGRVVLAYGDFSNAYFGDRGVYTFEMADQATVSSVNFWENDLIGVKATERVDIQFIDNNAFSIFRLK